ncbi:MAG TPA: hypothetical protein DDW50_13820 [Firmicutes bacterium]|jgi:isopentenyl diphosphate isomerase/L-lactate dehydrogenase-like FMN-dependent dehydrogenase|nr:hypothetical protein [Bacillota bacterium]
MIGKLLENGNQNFSDGSCVVGARGCLSRRNGEPILIDTGITRGTDVFKALALGANGVLVVRTVMAGLAAEEMEGVRKILCGTNEELRRVMSLTGSPDIQSVDHRVIWC